MTVQNPPAFLQTSASGTTAEDMRRLFTSLTSDTQGTLTPTDMAVAQNGTPNMSVIVSGGRAWIKGTLATYQGTYFVENRGNENLVIAASDPTNARFDLVIAEVRDSSYSGAFNDWRLRVVTGTPSGSPVVPSTPANSIALARVSVNAAASSITNANILDLRTFVGIHGGTWVCTSGSRPTGVPEGQEIYETDTDTRLLWNGTIWLPQTVAYLRTGTAWTAIASPSWNQVTTATLSLPPGKWLIHGFMAFGVLTTNPRFVSLRLRNATALTDLDTRTMGHIAGADTRPTPHVMATTSLTIASTIRLEANVDVIDGTQNFQGAKLMAIPVTAIL